jgi:hypothetical protein
MNSDSTFRNVRIIIGDTVAPPQRTTAGSWGAQRWTAEKEVSRRTIYGQVYGGLVWGWARR